MKLVLIILFLFLSIPVYAVTDTFQGSSVTTDTYISEDNTTTNYGGETTFYCVSAFSNHRFTTLLKFDISSIPSTATVSDATLTLDLVSGFSNDSFTLYLFRAFKPWVEGTSLSDGATWNSWDHTNSKEWGVAGANSTNDSGVDNSLDASGDDRVATETASVAKSSFTSPGEAAFNSASLTALVQGWINGTMTNNGVVETSTYSNPEGFCGSSENATEGNRPLLSVTYTIPEAAVSTVNKSLKNATLYGFN